VLEPALLATVGCVLTRAANAGRRLRRNSCARDWGKRSLLVMVERVQAEREGGPGAAGWGPLRV